tara:strand:+ start:149 stop:457 length:309 start_codon:yes stop_codon:yes gene_type:complete
MIRKFSKNKDVFMVVCADWEGFVEANDEKEAAALAIEKSDEIFKKNLKLSPTMTIYNVSKSYERHSATTDMSFMYTPDVLANAGMHSLSSKYNKLIELMKKK